ncbi:MAG: hypothetical protein U0228_25765 [Myxococcaceae bacterium]
MSRLAVIAALVLLGCGRTGVQDEPDGGRDAGPGPREAPVFVANGANCPVAGVEADLRPDAGERLLLVLGKTVEECSNAGGDAFIGVEVGSTRELWLGEHACWFLSNALRLDGEATYFGVARVQQTAGLQETVKGWCLTQLDGGEPVRSDVRVQAWGLYRSEGAARAAFDAL